MTSIEAIHPNSRATGEYQYNTTIRRKWAIGSSLTIVLLTVFIATGNWINSASANENVVIVLDDSGSMNEKMSSGMPRIESAKNAIALVIKQFQPNTQLGLLLLNGSKSKEHWAIPLSHLSVSQATHVVQLLRADGGTPLGHRLRDGAEALLKLREAQVYGTYRLLVVTDGEANDGRYLTTYLPDILSRGIIVDVIGVDMRQDHSLATSVHSYRRADDDAALKQAIHEVFAERLDTDGDSSESDFEWLKGLDDGLAKEVLSALAKPNNASITGKSRPSIDSNSSDGSSSSSWTWVLLPFAMCLTPFVLFLIFALSLVGRKKSKSKRGRN